MWWILLWRIWKALFVKGGWTHWLAFIAITCYGAVSVGCLNSKPGFTNLYTVEVKPDTGAVIKVGYFGVCVQTPDMAGKTHDWICSRFYGSTTKGLDKDTMKLVEHVRRLQLHGLYPLPAGAAMTLFICWVAFYVFRNRSDRLKGWSAIALWISCAIGFAAALIPMMLGNALMIVGPIYNSKTQTRFSVGGVVLTWIGFGFHLAYIISAQWYHHHVGGAGNYETGMHGLDGEP